MKRLIFAAVGGAGLVIVSSSMRPPAPLPPVTIRNVETSIDGDIWTIRATLVQHVECDFRRLERWFLSGGEKWQVAPFDSWPGSPKEATGSANYAKGEYPVWIKYKIRPGIRGVYRVTQDAGGCDNGWSGQAVSVEIPFDWTG